ncbi:MAG: hypothetical protein NC913_02605 [Candidatus Omnitrophica bacterium]|nr:hypothetical protein [Candidatus Omnitrophota bacterium]
MKQKMSVVESALKFCTFRADQAEVWNEISEKMSRHKISSQTEAMSDIYEKEKNRIEDYREKFKHVESQIGAVFALEGKIFGMDVFDKADTCRKLLPRIIRSYALEVIEIPEKKTKKKQPEVNDVEKFLKTLYEAEFSSRKSPGAGMTVTITGKKLTGTSLVAKDTVVHTSVFTMPDKEKRPKEYETGHIRRP